MLTLTGFPPDNPQVIELYWSLPQLQARAHPNLARVQKALMQHLWHVSSPSVAIDTSQPLVYADRLRIRQPGDAKFALGPHQDGGSVERWEHEGYGRGGVYDAVFAGNWEAYDPWDAAGRVDAVNDLHNGLGACSMFRMFQGWLSMSHCGPLQGTLLVNPLLRLATAYTLLRPFFTPVKGLDTNAVDASQRDAFLDPDNWVFTAGEETTSELQGATPGHGQEFPEAMHPHLELDRTMVHMPHVKPGDFVIWHCDSESFSSTIHPLILTSCHTAIHAVDKIHQGAADSSVLYIPVCPVTEHNARYLVRQRAAFEGGTPGPDFPGGKGESEHVGRPTRDAITSAEGLQAMGLEKMVFGSDAREGARRAVTAANAVLGF